ncbi:hypothetical protein EI94DRAFT_1726520 [Lactarius quietus]|nr:hypothetical protein EI94DRAFT_1726520 [Lactarius quietus]
MLDRQVDAAINAWRRVDVLVNNAGFEIGRGNDAYDATNFVGVMNVTNAVLPHMRSRREGSVVFIGSRSAFRNQIEVWPYAASKAALHCMISHFLCNVNGGD